VAAVPACPALAERTQSCVERDSSGLRPARPREHLLLRCREGRAAHAQFEHGMGLKAEPQPALAHTQQHPAPTEASPPWGQGQCSPNAKAIGTGTPTNAMSRLRTRFSRYKQRKYETK